MSARIDQLVQYATELANAGRWIEAEQVWLEVRRLEPRHPQALFSLGVHALQRGELDAAHGLLSSARNEAPQDLLVLLTLGTVCRERGDASGEREAIDAALIVDPYFLPALLAKAGWIERFATSAAAAAVYRDALRIAPPETHWPATLRPQLEHARTLVQRHSEALDAHLRRSIQAFEAGLGARQLAPRWNEAVSIMAGRSRAFVSNSNQLHVPRLPAQPFFEREQFPWLAALEAKTDIIRGELLAMLSGSREKFTPYIAYRPGEPVNQWKELNHSERWSALHLWRGGAPVHENLERCPHTAAALAAIPRVDIPGLCPNAMFSALAPRTRIPPHHGETNARLVAHLPLVVPEGCRFRVGFDERSWKVGEGLIFDDTLEHEAWNDSDEIRVVLIFDVWNPLLTDAECAMVRTLTAAAREFHG